MRTFEEFKKCLPEHIVVYVNEQNVPSLSGASLPSCIDTRHKNVFLTPEKQDIAMHVGGRKTRSPKISQRSQVARVFTVVNLAI